MTVFVHLWASFMKRPTDASDEKAKMESADLFPLK